MSLIEGKFGKNLLITSVDQVVNWSRASSLWPMLFGNLTIRLLGSDDFPETAKRQAAVDLTEAAARGALTPAIGEPPLLIAIGRPIGTAPAESSPAARS